MTKINKDNILYKLNFLQSLGYKYCEHFNLNVNIQNEHKLPNNLKSLNNIVDNCHLCSLSKSRKNILFGYGSENANIMFLYDEPNSVEDTAGEYYRGKNGELLALMIENVLKIKKEEVYISSMVKCKSSKDIVLNNDIHSCNSYLNKQIDLIQPKLLVILGQSAYELLFNEKTNNNDYKSKSLKYKNIETICTYHPSFLIRNPSLKKEAYYDMLKVKNEMEKF